jgi:DNA-binding LacI/PurR family transcriptional regulator
MKKMTVAEIAKLADVSPATVSRVINNQPGVRDEIRQKVSNAIATSGCLPRLYTSGLNAARLKVIALTFGDALNPFYSEMTNLLTQMLRKHGYETVVFNNEFSAEKEIEFIRMVRQLRFSGVISFTSYSELLEPVLQELDMPVVLVSKTFEGYTGDAVLLDNFQAGYLATRHLIELGHKQIAFAAGQMQLETIKNRYQGFLQFLHNYNVAFDEKNHLYVGQLTMDSGYKIAEQIFAQGTNAPSAIVLANDIMALGFLEGYRQHGAKIPEDISVVGFDNIAFSRFAHLTTIDHKGQELCERAIQIMLKRIEGYTGPSEYFFLTPKLIARETTAAFS